jgi:hypothetical protein
MAQRKNRQPRTETAIIALWPSAQSRDRLHRAWQSRPEQFEAVITLAAAYDELEHSADAVATVDAVLKLARKAGNSAQVKQFTEWLNAYQKGSNRP